MRYKMRLNAVPNADEGFLHYLLEGLLTSLAQALHPSALFGLMKHMNESLNEPQQPPSHSPLNKSQLFEVIVMEGVEAFNHYRRQTGYMPLDLSGLDFTAKDMAGINLSNTNLSGCNFDFAYLVEATLILADLSRASCRETDFYMANLEEADLPHTNLEQANFASASLSESVLEGCQAIRANFQDADLSHCNFRKAKLADADLTGANLIGADLRDAELEWANLEDVRFDASTQWGKKPPAFVTQTQFGGELAD